MSLCDTCIDPGRCCRRMHISGSLPDPRTGKRIGEPMSFEDAEHFAIRLGLPFVPGEQAVDGSWRYTCYNLAADGRCNDYENRPDLCRRYVAGSDRLCVHHWARPDALEALIEEAEALEAA